MNKIINVLERARVALDDEVNKIVAKEPVGALCDEILELTETLRANTKTHSDMSLEQRLIGLGLKPVANNVEYIGLFLRQEQVIGTIPPRHSNIYADHVTLLHAPTQKQVDAMVSNCGMDISVHTHKEYSDDRCQAVATTTSSESFIQTVFPDLRLPHITISTDDFTRPHYSNHLIQAGRNFSDVRMSFKGILGFQYADGTRWLGDKSDTLPDARRRRLSFPREQLESALAIIDAGMTEAKLQGVDNSKGATVHFPLASPGMSDRDIEILLRDALSDFIAPRHDVRRYVESRYSDPELSDNFRNRKIEEVAKRINWANGLRMNMSAWRNDAKVSR